ncbi:unnamed protein product [Rhizoctonia solani]|uniref:Uncharacterized protein n=1 Tax=Rhizoctonia solani TaxID=456999 RepID=A0A8H3H5E7_9AGAM|nr:unnamed protein product [Rhizoctonia solani]
MSRLAPFADPPPELSLPFVPETPSADSTPSPYPAPVPRPRFVPLAPSKSAPVQQRRFARVLQPHALTPNSAQPIAQAEPAERNATMSQYRLRCYGYATVKEDQTAGQVLRYEEPKSRRAWGRGKLRPEDLLREKELFERAEWLATMKGTDNDRGRYFEVHQNSLPYKNLDEMYQAVDNFEHGPEYRHFTFELETQHGADVQHVFGLDPIEAIRDLIGEPEWKYQMSYAPRTEWAIAADGREIQVFSEMASGRWWPGIQRYLPKGALLIPCMVSTDPTKLSQISGDKRGCPVYFSIGNINKAIRNRPSERAMILLGYLPDPKLEYITNQRERREKKWQIYHAAMRLLLDPLKKAGIEGIEVRCADGGVRRGYPVLAKQIGDWQEVCTGACSAQTRCPKCVEEYSRRGELGEPARLRTKFQTLQAILDAMNGHAAKSKKIGLRPTWPYWGDMPYANGGELVGPDILHQVHKGMFKTHLYQWCENILGEAEMDNRFRGLPRFHGLRHFNNGVSTISQWTGNEAKAMERTFVPIMAGVLPASVGRAIRALMNFFYRAHLPQLDQDDLRQMQVDLNTFHSNKEAFRIIGAYTSGLGWSGISKLHMLRHFIEQILDFGTTDGYTTETTERLHKYLVKNPYRQTGSAGNRTEQMLIRCQRSQAWNMAHSRLEREGLLPKQRPWDDDGDFCGGCEYCVVDVEEVEIGATGEGNHPRPRNDTRALAKEPTVCQPTPRIVIAKRPTIVSRKLEDVAREQAATGFWDALQDYIDTVEPDLTYQLQPTLKIGTWSFFKLAHSPLPFAPLVGSLLDFVRATPARAKKNGELTREQKYDTVLIEEYEGKQGIYRYRAARVRVIFQLNSFCRRDIPEPLAYVELFDRFSQQLRPSELVSTRPSFNGRHRKTAVIPLTRIRMACQLVPKYADEPDRRPISSSDDLLETFPQFLFNPYSTYFSWSLWDHWARLGVN